MDGKLNSSSYLFLFYTGKIEFNFFEMGQNAKKQKAKNKKQKKQKTKKDKNMLAFAKQRAGREKI